MACVEGKMRRTTQIGILIMLEVDQYSAVRHEAVVSLQPFLGAHAQAIC